MITQQLYPDGPAAPEPQIVAVGPVTTGSLAPGLGHRETEKILSLLKHRERLEKMTARELIDTVLETDAADYNCVIELMNRVLPGWYNDGTREQENASDVPDAPTP